MTHYELTEQERNTCLAFLARVDLKGQEVQAFITVINALNTVREDYLPRQKKKTKGEKIDEN